MKYIVTLNGKNYEVDVTETEEAIVTNVTDANSAPAAPVAPVTPAAAPSAPAAPVVAGNGTQIKSPMPGAILKVNASQGQKVNE